MSRSVDELMNSTRIQWAKEGLVYMLTAVSPSIPRVSGKLLAQTRAKSALRVQGDGFTIRPGTFYGHILDVAGYKAHDISGRKTRGKRGRWILKIPTQGGSIFRRAARIPAFRPTYFMRNAINAAEPGLLSLTQAKMTGALNDVVLNRVIRVGK